MTEPVADDLTRETIQLVHARVDVLCAAALAGELLELGDNAGYRAWGLLTGMVVSYARPFTNSYAYGRLSGQWAEFPERHDLKKHHDRLLVHRNTLLAHTDLTEHRGVVVFTSGVFAETPEVTEERARIEAAGIREVRELFAFQEERMGVGCRDLVARLEDLEGWPPGQEIRLRLPES